MGIQSRQNESVTLEIAHKSFKTCGHGNPLL